MTRAITLAASIVLACAVGSTLAQQTPQQTPPTKGKSAERKATPPARSGWDISKGGGTTARKAPAPTTNTTKPRQGLEANGTTAQGVAHE